MGPSKVSTLNWSGVALTNKLTKWNTKTSFTDIYSVFSVPTSQLPFGASQCDSPVWNQLSWAGIDGYNPFFVTNGALQGGMSSYIQCGVPTPTYIAYVGWGVLSGVFTVNPGDIMYVDVSNGLGGLNPGTVFIEDLSTLTYNSYSVPAPNNLSPLIGNSAQWVVERPCCLGSNPYPLLNTIAIFFDGGAAQTGNGHLFYPGSTATSTAVMTQLAFERIQNQLVLGQLIRWTKSCYENVCLNCQLVARECIRSNQCPTGWRSAYSTF